MLESIRALLAASGVAFRELQHEPTRTSEASAAARGEPLSVGGKAIVLKVDQAFHLFVLSAARRLDSRAVKQFFKARRVRFASAEELHELTGLVPGQVPPFGRPILPLALYVDASVLEQDRIAFNAGSLTDSIVMERERYVEIARPAAVFRFSRD